MSSRYNASLKYGNDIQPLTVTEISHSAFSVGGNLKQLRDSTVFLPRIVREKPLSVVIQCVGIKERERFRKFIRKVQTNVRKGPVAMTFTYPNRKIKYKVHLESLSIDYLVEKFVWDFHLDFVILGDPMREHNSAVAHEIVKTSWWIN